MTAMDFWEREQQSNRLGAASSDSEFNVMNSWTVGMFRLAMKFAEAYALQQEHQRQKEQMAGTCR